jgi:K+-transporting ATPase KdpF subunit
LKEAAMLFDYTMGGLTAALILVYLIYALIRPERF